MNVKILIVLFCLCFEWMFLGMSFFLDWHPLVEIGIILVYAYIGFATFIVLEKEIRMFYDTQNKTLNEETKEHDA